jgi:hypothetical protein
MRKATMGSPTKAGLLEEMLSYLRSPRRCATIHRRRFRAIARFQACPGCHCMYEKVQKSTEKYLREDETVAVDPFGVLGVESHELVPDDVGHRGHTHGGTRMARVCLECGIDLCRNTKSQPLSLSKHLWIASNELLPLLLGAELLAG